MGLLINQGVQDVKQDNKFNPITAKDVTLEIFELKLAPTMANTLEVTLRILDGVYKNKFIFDRVTFDANSPMSWKYRQLRKCAGVAYKEGESTTIDIEALLLHKAVKADLGVRKGKNKEGVEQDYQDIKYKMSTQKATVLEPVQQGSIEKPSKQIEEVVEPTKQTTHQLNDLELDMTDEADWD